MAASFFCPNYEIGQKGHTNSAVQKGGNENEYAG